LTALRKELDFARALAREAGELALRYFGRDLRTEYKDGREPVTAADRAVNELIVEAVRREYPADAVLAEESPPDPRRFDARRTWMIDPIDGTSEFIAGADGWGVLIGLCDGGRPVLGVLDQPLVANQISGARGEGAFVEARSGDRRPLRGTRDPDARIRRLAVSVRGFEALLEKVKRDLNVSDVISAGGFAGRAILAMTGEVDAVLYAGGRPKEWDTCALQAVLEESDFAITSCAGEPLTYLKANPVQSHGILIAPASLMPRLSSAVAPHYQAALASRCGRPAG
jgi:fructose-1,6-bisphosphatase/inositol monophosphatase family enzyme